MPEERAKVNSRRGVLICGSYGHGNAGDEAILDAQAASGSSGKCRPASTVARPAFCIPTSIERVRRFAFPMRVSSPVI